MVAVQKPRIIQDEKGSSAHAVQINSTEIQIAYRIKVLQYSSWPRMAGSSKLRMPVQGGLGSVLKAPQASILLDQSTAHYAHTWT